MFELMIWNPSPSCRNYSFLIVFTQKRQILPPSSIWNIQTHSWTGPAAVSFVYVTFLLACPTTCVSTVHITTYNCLHAARKWAHPVTNVWVSKVQAATLKAQLSPLHSHPPCFKPNSAATAVNRQCFSDLAPSVNSKTLPAGNTTDAHSLPGMM